MFEGLNSCMRFFKKLTLLFLYPCWFNILKLLLLILPEIVNWFLANSGSNLEPWAAELRSGKIAKPGEGKPAPGESEPSQPGEGTLFKYFKDSVQGK